MARDKTENRKEPSHGATLRFLLCGMTRLVFCNHPQLPSDKKPCSGWRNTVWKLLRILDKKCWQLHQSRKKGEYEKRLGFRAIWYVQSMDFSVGLNVRGEERGATGITGLIKLTGQKSLRLEVLEDVLACEGLGSEKKVEIKNIILDVVDLSCFFCICEEKSSRQLYKWHWSSMEKSRLEMRICESSVSTCQ